jgi:hypothetical protein
MFVSSASQSRAADSVSVSSTAGKSKVERLMTFNTSAVAVCCSRASFSSRVRATSCSCMFSAGWSAIGAFRALGSIARCPLDVPLAVPRRFMLAPGGSRRWSILRKFQQSRHVRNGSRPCGNVFRPPKTARNRARWTSTRPSEPIFAVSGLESIRAQPQAMLTT